MKPGQDLELIHDFLCSHHGSGPVDSFSKDARHGMDADVATGKFVRYNYEHCYEWCIKNMALPDEKKKHRGTFGANGNYFWRAYSDGEDVNEKGFPVIPDDRHFRRFQVQMRYTISEPSTNTFLNSRRYFFPATAQTVALGDQKTAGTAISRIL